MVIMKNSSPQPADDQLSVTCQPTVGRQSADCWPTVDRHRLSADCFRQLNSSRYPRVSSRQIADRSPAVGGGELFLTITEKIIGTVKKSVELWCGLLVESVTCNKHLEFCQK